MITPNRLLKAVQNPGLAASHVLRRGASHVERYLPIGTNIYERDWDVLVVLDACRRDLFNAFAPQHDVYRYVTDHDTITSVASATPVWLRRTFENAPSRAVQDTHYVTCTAYADRVLDEAAFHEITHVWRYAEDPASGQTRPEAVTDAAIHAIRNSDANRFIVHYIQPHAPFLHCLGKYDSRANTGEAGSTQAVWRGLRDDQYDRDEVWRDYGRNLLRGLDEVQTLAENTARDIVITSDHGNALGELGIYGHPRYAATPVVRKVPWVRVECPGGGDYKVKGRDVMATDAAEPSITENLEALGYRA